MDELEALMDERFETRAQRAAWERKKRREYRVALTWCFGWAVAISIGVFAVVRNW